MTSKAKFICNFVYGKDGSSPATDEQMAQVYGEDWENIPMGKLEDRLNEILQDGWSFDMNNGSCRSNDKGSSIAIIQSSLRHSTGFYLHQVRNPQIFGAEKGSSEEEA